jgi:hypothetical protein
VISPPRRPRACGEPCRRRSRCSRAGSEPVPPHPTGASPSLQPPGSSLFRSCAARPTGESPRARRPPRATPRARRSSARGSANDAGCAVDCSTVSPAFIHEIGGDHAGGRCDDAVGAWQCGAGVRDGGVVATLVTPTRSAGQRACERLEPDRTRRFLPRPRVPTLSPGGRQWRARSGRPRPWPRKR